MEHSGNILIFNILWTLFESIPRNFIGSLFRIFWEYIIGMFHEYSRNIYLPGGINWPKWVVVQKLYSKMHRVSCNNTHHDVTDLVNYKVVKTTKTWISWERNITFLRNKKNSWPVTQMTHIEKLSLKWRWPLKFKPICHLWDSFFHQQIGQADICLWSVILFFKKVTSALCELVCF